MESFKSGLKSFEDLYEMFQHYNRGISTTRNENRSVQPDEETYTLFLPNAAGKLIPSGKISGFNVGHMKSFLGGAHFVVDDEARTIYRDRPNALFEKFHDNDVEAM